MENGTLKERKCLTEAHEEPLRDVAASQQGASRNAAINNKVLSHLDPSSEPLHGMSTAHSTAIGP